eukprot:gene23444-31744_t
MGCSSSKTLKASTAKPGRKQLKTNMSMGTLAKRTKLREDVKTKTAGVKLSKANSLWLHVGDEVAKGTFSDWDKYELKGSEEPDYFSSYDQSDTGDYAQFMKQEEFTCDKEIVWPPETMAQLDADKTARGDIFRDAKDYGDS